MTKTNFNTESIDLRTESNDEILFSTLISLIEDKDQIKFLSTRFNIDGEELIINIEKIDIAFKNVKKWTTKFQYQNSEFSGNQISNYFVVEEDETLDASFKDMVFNIPMIKMDNGDKYENVKCRAIYSSKDQFYDDLKLTTHVNC